MKVLIVTHIDMDGSGVEILWRLAFPDADVMRVNYGWEDDLQNRKKLMNYDMILFGDISFRPSFARLLDKLDKNVILCDHHDSAIRKFEEEDTKYDWMELDTNRCGTLIVYDQLKRNYKDFDITGKYRELAILIDDYDRWIHNNSMSIDLQFLWNGIGKDTFVDKFLYSPSLIFTRDEQDIIHEGWIKLNTSIIEAEKSMTDLLIDCEGLKFSYIPNVLYQVSLTAMEIQKRHPELDYIVLNGGYGSASIRSTRCKINHIAEALGGGGHELSAGFSIEDTTDVVTSILNRKLSKYSFVTNLNLRSN